MTNKVKNKEMLERVVTDYMNEDSQLLISKVKRSMGYIVDCKERIAILKDKMPFVDPKIVKWAFENKKEEWELKGIYMFKDKDEAVKELYDIEQECINAERTTQSIIWDLLSMSNHRIDEYGTPDAVSLADIKLSDEDWDVIQREVFEDIENDVIASKYPKKDVDDTINFVVESMSLVMELFNKSLGKQSQSLIKPIAQLTAQSIIRKLSGKKDKKYPQKLDYPLMDDLELYWRKNLPMCKYDNCTEFQHNRKTWFLHLEEKYGKKFKGIEAFELRYRPSYFKTSK